MTVSRTCRHNMILAECPICSQQQPQPQPYGTGGATPLVTITFVNRADAPLTRHWYHVPRIGDAVYLNGPDGYVLTGTVGGVKWDSDGSVLVYLR